MVETLIAGDMPRVEACLASVSEVDFPVLQTMLGHVLGHPGKLLRPAITLLAGQFYTYDLDLLVPMATAMELLHIATLVHDDMVDGAATRRGQATLNRLWTGGTAVLVGDYLFAKSADLVATTDNVRAMGLFARTLMVICNGELRQAFTRYNWRQTRDDYYGKIERKTAALFATAAESGAILSGAPEPAIAALRQFGYNFGMAFQIVDDILDYVGDPKEVGKPVGGDLLAGTVTLPALRYLETHPDDGRIARFLERHAPVDELDAILTLIRESGAIQDSYAVADEFRRAATTALESLPESTARPALERLAAYILERRH